MWRGLTNAQWARAPRVSVKLSKLCRQTHSCLALRKDPSTIPLCPGDVGRDELLAQPVVRHAAQKRRL